MDKVIISWSGGKDCSMAYYEARKTLGLEISALITTVTEVYGRISMHGVRRTLLKQQAESLGVPVCEVIITPKATNEEYEDRMRAVLTDHKNQGVSSVVIGDIFLEDLRKYREEKLSEINMKGIFPLWKRDTTQLANTFIDMGFKAIITCVDSKSLDKKFVGRNFDHKFLSELPSGIDPCGENGEFHSFVTHGPIFRQPIACRKGEIVLRDKRFYFCDLIPS